MLALHAVIQLLKQFILKSFIDDNNNLANKPLFSYIWTQMP